MFVIDNTISSFRNYFNNNLKEIYELGEVEQLFNLTFYYYKGWDKISLRLNLEEHLSESELLELRNIVKRLKSSEPIQHIFSKTEFFDLEFYINGNVLVPRQETEELVDVILKNNSTSSISLLDIGTGSGCIPIAIASINKQIKVSAVDVSEEAIKVAKINAEKNNVELTLFCNDIFEINDLNNLIPESIDVIVSNPPYITMKEKIKMHKNVLEFDPHLALFVENDSPLLFYKKITQLAFDKLAIGGELYFEINDSFGQETLSLVKSYGFTKVILIQDLNENDRIIYAVK